MASKNQLVFLALVLVLAASQNPWCSTYDSSTVPVCTDCYGGYYLDVNSICQWGNAFCKTFAADRSGNCASCYYDDYSGPLCAYNPGATDPWCSNKVGGVCTACYAGYYLNSVTVLCTLGNLNCATFAGNGDCTSCHHTDYSGPLCAYNPAASDPFCSAYVGGVCNACYSGYYLNSVTILCTLGNINCATFAGNGDCTSCHHTDYSGPLCAYNPAASDPFCSAYVGGVCNACYSGYYLNSVTILCTLGNINCATFAGNGDCTSCHHTDYNGPLCAYNPPVVVNPPITHCQTQAGNVCTACYAGYYVNAGDTCSFGNQNCNGFTNDKTGRCAACWSGYSLNVGQTDCVAAVIVAPPTDWYCSSRGAGNVCTGCYTGYFVHGVTGICVPADPWCRNYAAVGGVCGLCWSPYHPSAVDPTKCVWP